MSQETRMGNLENALVALFSFAMKIPTRDLVMSPYKGMCDLF